MPDLKSSLKGLDKDYLMLLAKMWGIEAEVLETEEIRNILLRNFKDPTFIEKNLEDISSETKAALDDLIYHQGKLPWSTFCRNHGELRIMGPAKLEREGPYVHPISATEWLWYHGIIFKAFLGQGDQLQEYAYLPDEFYRFLTPSSSVTPQLQVFNPIQEEEEWCIKETNDNIVDDACTLLSALRMGIKPNECCRFNIPIHILMDLLHQLEVIDQNHSPIADKTKLFLESPRNQALSSLGFLWLESKSFNELFLISDLIIEGRIKSNPLKVRNEILKHFRHLSADHWYDTGTFVDAIKKVDPDFLRTAGEYDSWLIREKHSNEYLHGFNHWGKVEGNLILVVLKMCYWLGMMDFAFEKSNDELKAFKITKTGNMLLNHEIPPEKKDENEKLTARSNGQLLIPRFVPRAVRYQISRFCTWIDEMGDTYRYSISPATLKQAERQGLIISQLETLLKNHAKLPLPPTLLKAMHHWEKSHLQAKFESTVLLRVTESPILDQLEKSRAKRFIQERINPTTMIIKSGGQNAVQQTLIELGYLSEIDPLL